MTRPKKKRQPFPNPKAGQHTRLNLEDLTWQYKAKMITALGLVYNAVKIYRSNGQKLRINDVPSFCEKLGIHRDTFYDSISRLKTNPDISFEWEDLGGIALWIPEDEDSEVSVGNSRQERSLPDNNGSLPDNNGSLPDNNGSLPDNNLPEPAPNKESSPSSYILHISNKSLSNSERENFLNFAKKKATQLPNPPQLIDRWIEAYQAELYAEFQKSFLPATSSAPISNAPNSISEACEQLQGVTATLSPAPGTDPHWDAIQRQIDEERSRPRVKYIPPQRKKLGVNSDA